MVLQAEVHPGSVIGNPDKEQQVIASIDRQVEIERILSNTEEPDTRTPLIESDPVLQIAAIKKSKTKIGEILTDPTLHTPHTDKSAAKIGEKVDVIVDNIEDFNLLESVKKRTWDFREFLAQDPNIDHVEISPSTARMQFTYCWVGHSVSLESEIHYLVNWKSNVLIWLERHEILHQTLKVLLQQAALWKRVWVGIRMMIDESFRDKFKVMIPSFCDTYEKTPAFFVSIDEENLDIVNIHFLNNAKDWDKWERWVEQVSMSDFHKAMSVK